MTAARGRDGALARLGALALVAGLATASAQAQTRPGRTADAAAVQEVLSLREKVRAAVAAKDKAALEAIYAENFRHLRDSGRIDPKVDRIALLLSGEATIETAAEEGLEVQLYGTATAVATAVSVIKDRATGRSAPFRWLTVYIRDGEASWRVALSQASRATGR